MSEEPTGQPAVRIEGGAGPHEAAAIAAAVQLVLAEQRALRAKGPSRPKLSDWIRVLRTDHPARPGA